MRMLDPRQPRNLPSPSLPNTERPRSTEPTPPLRSHGHGYGTARTAGPGSVSSSGPSTLIGAGEEEAAVVLRPGVEALLRRLRYSNLAVAICHPEDMPTNESGFLQKKACLYSFGDVALPAINENHSLNELMLEWSRTSSCCYVTSRVDEDLFSELRNHKWRVIVVDNECGTRDSGVLNIGKLQELLLTLANLIKKDGLIIFPLSFELPLASQLQEVDMILHKVTDQIINIDPNCSINFPKGNSFSAGMSKTIRLMEEHPDLCMIDPFKNIYPLLHHLQIQQILLRLQELDIEGRPTLQAPSSLKVENFHGGELQKQLSEANLSFPAIVKPQVA